MLTLDRPPVREIQCVYKIWIDINIELLKALVIFALVNIRIVGLSGKHVFYCKHFNGVIF